MTTIDYTDRATYLRAALLLGLIAPAEVIAWADAALHDDPAPPQSLVEVALAAPELTALRAALQPLAAERESASIVRELLQTIARDVRDGRRSIDDTVHVFAQMRRMVRVSDQLAVDLDQFEDEHMLANAGIGPAVEKVREKIGAWLTGWA